MNGASAQELPFVSVVIPVLNCAGEVDSCIAHLRAQDYPEDLFEILVVDNGSEDDTVARLKKCGVTPLSRPERGRSRALNEGLKHARGSIICSTDISCRAEPRWLTQIVRSFDDPLVGCVAGDIKLLKTNANLASDFQERSDYMSPMKARLRIHPPFLPYADGANASFRRSVFDAIGPFEESFIKAADVEICYRMLFLTEFKIAFNPRAVVWEPGEENLKALLKQRYRIGIGNALLWARFPGLYANSRARSARAHYWAAREVIGSSAKTLGLLLRSGWRAEARTALADSAIASGMSIAQSLGRIRGRQYLRSADTVPQPISVSAMDALVAGAWTASSRIIII